MGIKGRLALNTVVTIAVIGAASAHAGSGRGTPPPASTARPAIPATPAPAQAAGGATGSARSTPPTAAQPPPPSATPPAPRR
nr:hypothetical protein [Streptomyces sp. MH191]